MNKLNRKLLIFLFLIFSLQAQAQQKSFGNNFIFEVVSIEKKTMVKQPFVLSIADTALYHLFSKLSENPDANILHSEPKSPLLLGVKLNAKLQRYFSGPVYSQTKEYPVYLISDSSDAILISMGITEANRSQYQYRVVENDSLELVKWSPIPKMEQKYGSKQPYGSIGKYNYPGKRIMVEVAQKTNYSIRDGVVFDWRINYKPILQQIVISTPHSYFNLRDRHLNKGYATGFDKNDLPQNFKFPLDSVTRVLFQFKKQETLVHLAWLIRNFDGKKDTLRIGFLDAQGNVELDGRYFAQSGNYDFVVQQQQKMPAWDDANLVRVSFSVFDASLMNKKYALKNWLPYLLGLMLLTTLGFLAYRQFHKVKLQALRRQRTQTQLQLKTIRSQLNPHFIFNALSSIQNLMNKNNLLDANLYLSKFAGLTRKVLVTSEQEMISLAEELKITEDYLQLEQLRFGFTYTLNVDSVLDLENIDVPAILLQPFIENAVKHGISKLKSDGLITINVEADGYDLIFTIKDNGQGFLLTESMDKVGAFGLKLSKQRLDLLNQVYKTQPATLAISSHHEGTTVTLKIKNWISNGD